MAVTETVKKTTVNVKLNNGTVNGTVQTVTISLGNMSETNYNAQKVMNVVNLLGECLKKPIYAVEKVEVSTLTESA